MSGEVQCTLDPHPHGTILHTEHPECRAQIQDMDTARPHSLSRAHWSDTLTNACISASLQHTCTVTRTPSGQVTGCPFPRKPSLYPETLRGSLCHERSGHKANSGTGTQQCQHTHDLGMPQMCAGTPQRFILLFFLAFPLLPYILMYGTVESRCQSLGFSYNQERECPWRHSGRTAPEVRM